GQDDHALTIEVTWPNGKVENFQAEAKAGSTLLLREGTGRSQDVQLGRANLPDPLTRAETLALSLKIRAGQPFPDLTVRRLDATDTTLHQQLRPGRRTLINLWATWCVPCSREMPELEQLRPRLAANGVDLIGLNVDADPQAKIAQFVSKTKVQYPVF